MYVTFASRVLRCRGFDYKRGVVTHRENIIERELQTEPKKLNSKKAFLIPIIAVNRH